SSEAAEDMAPDTNSRGRDLRVACHTGTAVFETRTAVYALRGSPATPDNIPPPRPTAPTTPRQSPNRAAATDPGVLMARTHEPTLMGEVGRNTRSMLRNRSGRPRSFTSSAVPATSPSAEIHRHRVTSPSRSSLSTISATIPRTAAAPAAPPV